METFKMAGRHPSGPEHWLVDSTRGCGYLWNLISRVSAEASGETCLILEPEKINELQTAEIFERNICMKEAEQGVLGLSLSVIF
jgi:hypothetical protein